MLLTEEINGAAQNLTREEQDEFSARSHQRAAEAWKNGLFDDEVVPVAVPQRRGDPVMVTTDEGVRGDTTAESLSKLRPAFSKDGTITAGSASQISDGAAAVVVMSKAKAEELGLTWLAEIGAHGMVAGPDSSLQSQPANATALACQKEGISPADLDLVEFNEAFAAVGIASARELGLPEDKVNVNGGAIALGHPVGMSGTRVVLHAGPRAQAPRWRRRRRRALRWRWPGRRPDRACPVAGRDQQVDGPRQLRAPGPVRPRAVARLVSMVEDGSPQLREVMAALTPHAGHAQVVGITGSPGVGKSTTTNALVTRAPQGRQAGRRARGRPVVAVLRRRAAGGPGADAGPRDATRASTSARWPPAATSAGCRGRPRRRCGCSTPRAATW